MSHSRWEAGIVVDHPGRHAPWAAWFARRALFPLVWLLHRPTLQGLENLPASEPFLLVANHNGGMGLAEILTFVALWARAFGSARPIAGFALPVAFKVFPLSRVMGWVGAIPSTYAAAMSALQRGSPILLFPGGDHEALRPIWQAGRVDWGGRVGFLRIAREARVKIVPLGIQGAHFTAPILMRSTTLANMLLLPRLFAGKRWALTVLGLGGAVAIALLAPWSWPVRAVLVWVWLGSPFVLSPWLPWTIHMRIGKPIAAEELFAVQSLGTRQGHDEELPRALARVEGAVQSLVSPGGSES
jgi:1-acyl-sn-glycerol-3-phosphate acyltransferase